MIPSMQRLAGLMQVALVAAFALALGGAFIPGRIGHACGAAGIVILIVAPIVRVAWLTTSWARVGDRKFSLLGGALLTVLAVGAVLAFVR
jgi:hypothetical protein